MAPPPMAVRTVRVPVALWRRADRAARSSGLTISDVLRVALTAWLDRQEASTSDTPRPRRRRAS